MLEYWTWKQNLPLITKLSYREAILKSVANHFSVSYHLAEPAEESQGIDGFIGDKPVSTKPSAYEIKKALSETIEVPILYYEKVKDGVRVMFNENLFA